MDLQGSQNLPQKFAAHFYLTVNVSYQINAHHPTKAVQVIKGEQVIFDETGKLHTRLKIDNTFFLNIFVPLCPIFPSRGELTSLMKKEYEELFTLCVTVFCLLQSKYWVSDSCLCAFPMILPAIFPDLDSLFLFLPAGTLYQVDTL